MQCLDCTTTGTPSPAIGICTTCGAAVCRGCVRVGFHPVNHRTVFGSAEQAVTETRQLACPSCATALSARHAGNYRFAPLADPVPEMQ